MGARSSHPQNDMMVDHHPQYPDMNLIWKGLPKMIQVADDMHRMTDYIMDLRNMTLCLVAISTVGLLGFLLLRYVHSRSNRQRRKRSLRNAEEQPHGYPAYYHPGYAAETWDRPKSQYSQHSIHAVERDEKKAPNDSSRGSPEHRPNGNVPCKVFPYKTSAFDEIRGGEEEALGTPPVTKTSTPAPFNDVPAYRSPNGAHKGEESWSPVLPVPVRGVRVLPSLHHLPPRVSPSPYSSESESLLPKEFSN